MVPKWLLVNKNPTKKSSGCNKTRRWFWCQCRWLGADEIPPLVPRQVSKLGYVQDSWGIAQAGVRGLRTNSIEPDAPTLAEFKAVSDVAEESGLKI